MAKENRVSSQEVYNYLVEKHGLSHNKAMGILSNIAGESDFIINAVGDNGSSYGLFQYNIAGNRRENMIEYVGEDWETDWKGQVDFIFEEDNKDSRMKQYLEKEYNSIEDAAHSFQFNFERPKIEGADELKELQEKYNENPTEELKNQIIEQEKIVEQNARKKAKGRVEHLYDLSKRQSKDGLIYPDSSEGYIKEYNEYQKNPNKQIPIPRTDDKKTIPITPGDGEPPIVKENDNQEEITKENYTIQKDDTLSQLAEKFDTTVEELMELNPNIKDKDKIYTGDKLVIPTKKIEGKPNYDDELNEIIEEIENIEPGSDDEVNRILEAIGKKNERIQNAKENWKSEGKGELDWDGDGVPDVDDMYPTENNKILMDKFNKGEITEQEFRDSLVFPSDPLADDDGIMEEEEDTTDYQAKYQELLEKLDSANPNDIPGLKEEILNLREKIQEESSEGTKIDDAGLGYETEDGRIVIGHMGEEVELLGEDSYNKQYEELLKELDNAGPNDIPIIKQKIQELDNKLRQSQEIIKEQSKWGTNELDFDGDGVPDIRDAYPTEANKIMMDEFDKRQTYWEYVKQGGTDVIGERREYEEFMSTPIEEVDFNFTGELSQEGWSMQGSLFKNIETFKDKFSKYGESFEKNIGQFFKKIFEGRSKDAIDSIKNWLSEPNHRTFVEFISGNMELYRNIYSKDEVKDVLKSVEPTLYDRPIELPEVEKYNQGTYVKLKDFMQPYHESGNPSREQLGMDTPAFYNDDGTPRPINISNYGLDEDMVFFIPHGNKWGDEWIAFNNEEELLVHSGGQMPEINTLDLEEEFYNMKSDAANLGYEERAGEAVDMIPEYIMEDLLSGLESAKNATEEANNIQNNFTPYSEYSTIPYTSEFSQKFKQKYFRGVPHDPDTGTPYTYNDISNLYTKPEDVMFMYPGPVRDRNRDEGLAEGAWQFTIGAYGPTDDSGLFITDKAKGSQFEHLIELLQAGYVLDDRMTQKPFIDDWSQTRFREVGDTDPVITAILYPPGSYKDDNGAWVNEDGYHYVTKNEKAWGGSYWDDDEEHKQHFMYEGGNVMYVSSKKYTPKDFPGLNTDDPWKYMQAISDVENGGYWDVKTQTMFQEGGVHRDVFGRLIKTETVVGTDGQNYGIEYKITGKEGQKTAGREIVDDYDWDTDDYDEALDGYWRPTNKGIRNAKKAGMPYDSSTDHFYTPGSYKKGGEWFTPNGLQITLDERYNEVATIHLPKNIRNSETYKKTGWQWNNRDKSWYPPNAFRGEDGRFYIDVNASTDASGLDIIEDRGTEDKMFEIQKSTGENVSIDNAHNINFNVSIPITGSNIDEQTLIDYNKAYPDGIPLDVLENELSGSYTFVNDGKYSAQDFPGLPGLGQGKDAKVLAFAGQLKDAGYVWALEHGRFFQPGTTKGYWDPNAGEKGEFIDDNNYYDSEGYVYRSTKLDDGTYAHTWQHTNKSMQNAGWVQYGDGFLPPGTYVDENKKLRVQVGSEKDDKLDRFVVYHSEGKRDEDDNVDSTIGERFGIKVDDSGNPYYRVKDDEGNYGENIPFTPNNSADRNLRNFSVSYSVQQIEDFRYMGMVQSDLALNTTVSESLSPIDGSNSIWLPEGSYKDDDGNWRMPLDSEGYTQSSEDLYYTPQRESGSRGLDSIYSAIPMTKEDYDKYNQTQKDALNDPTLNMQELVGDWNPWQNAVNKIGNFWDKHGKTATTLLQAGTGILAMHKAMKDIPVEDMPELSPDFKAFQRMSKELAQSGMDPKTKYAARKDLGEAYNAGITNAMRASGGSRATFLANAGVLNANKVKGLLKLSAVDAEQRKKNMDSYGKVMAQAETFLKETAAVENKMKYAELKRQSDVFGGVGSSLIGNIINDLSYSETMKEMQPMIEEQVNLLYQQKVQADLDAANTGTGTEDDNTQTGS